MGTNKKFAYQGGKPQFSTPFVLKHSWDDSVRHLLDGIVEDGRVAHFYGGPLCRRFEQEFAVTQKASYGVAMNSGTSALHVCYRLCGVGPGDEVVVPAHAYVSALSAVLLLDAVPVLCDVDPVTYGLDPAALEKCLSPRTKVVTAVHLYGRPCAVDAIVDKVSHTDAVVVEDCGQGHGAELGGRPVGSFSPMSAWSFFEIKHVCTGEGGMCLFRDKADADRARSLVYKGKGRGWWDYFEMGYSYMFTEAQAAFGLASLARYHEHVQLRRSVERAYCEVLSDAPGLEVLWPPRNVVTGAFKTPFRIERPFRDRVSEFLAACEAENIPIQKGYPALHNIDWIRSRSHRAWQLRENAKIRPSYDGTRVPVADDLCGRTLSLGTGPGISVEDAHDIAALVRDLAAFIFRKA